MSVSWYICWNNLNSENKFLLNIIKKFAMQRKDQCFSSWNEYDNLSSSEALTHETVEAVNNMIYVLTAELFCFLVLS